MAVLRAPMMNTAVRLLQARFPNELLRSLSSCRKVLPPELSRDTVKLTCDSTAKGGVCDVHLVGVRHNSPESCQLVRDVVNFLKPEVVFLELCQVREVLLHLDPYLHSQLVKALQMRPGILNRCRHLYAKVTNGYKFVESEFRVAYEVAQKYGAKVILGDIDTHITTERLHRKLRDRPLSHIMKFLISPFHLLFVLCDKRMWQARQAIKNKEYKFIIFKNAWYRLSFPAYVETILDERDQYMSAMLLQVAREHNSVVAIVGKGHVPGIQKYWKQPIQVEQLLTVPSKK